MLSHSALVQRRIGLPVCVCVLGEGGVVPPPGLLLCPASVVVGWPRQSALSPHCWTYATEQWMQLERPLPASRPSSCSSAPQVRPVSRRKTLEGGLLSLYDMSGWVHQAGIAWWEQIEGFLIQTFQALRCHFVSWWYDSITILKNWQYWHHCKTHLNRFLAQHINHCLNWLATGCEWR